MPRPKRLGDLGYRVLATGTALRIVLGRMSVGTGS